MYAINPPFRADHVGSLLRPPQLKEARRRDRHPDVALDQPLDRSPRPLAQRTRRVERGAIEVDRDDRGLFG